MHLEPINTDLSQSTLTVILKPSNPTHPSGNPDLVIQDDFNNILANIKGNLELIKLDKANYELQKRSLSNIDFAVNRGKDITNQLLNFSRKGEKNI